MTVVSHDITHMFISQQTYDRHHQCSEHWFFDKLQLVQRNLTPQFAKTDEKCKMITCA